ncbi:TPA: hypothetical protein N0F65_009751 [Lagenidium giganteum]|uniref:DUF1279 domain-containing protein n=1 Tax=Lagenidium giganteum TaxID=4803 RepID=A0AAV2YJD5_9STRA|nr:TPA: hypothetical protein N0F65_009751 [Lagenidium giganteum]
MPALYARSWAARVSHNALTAPRRFQSASTPFTRLLFPSSSARLFATASGGNHGDDDKAPLTTNKTYAELEAEVAKLQDELEQLKKEGKKSKAGKLMAMIKEYGPALVVWYSTLYVSTGVGIYTGLEMGAFGGADAFDLIHSFGLDRYVDVNSFDPKYGNVALAFILNELLEPVRAPLALATIPTIKRVFARKKAPTPSS